MKLKKFLGCLLAGTVLAATVAFSSAAAHDSHTFGQTWHGNVYGHFHVCTGCGAADLVSEHVLDGSECKICHGIMKTGDPIDLNDDSDVNGEDAVYLLGYTLRPEMFPIADSVLPDCDGNSLVDSDDAIYLLNYVLRPDLYPLHNLQFYPAPA